ncbi:MAG: CDP-alcohol phosphatidyltransferase family protein [Thermoplasmata archaeon]|nr:MAG: CDP-alcohol phosphatidyltransferase family protein [Thermoplasmata archaeon]
MLDKYRYKADEWLEPLAKKFSLEANKLSYLSFIFAIFAGITAYFSYEKKWLLLVSAFLILMNGFFDALDGKIARLKGMASKKGDFVDHAIDRFSDAFIIGGIVASPWVDKLIGLIAFASVMLVSYLGTQAQAVGYKRVYAGLLGRADRIVVLFIACVLQFFFNAFYGYSVLELFMMYFAIAGIITIVQRYYLVMKWFIQK